HPGAGALVEPPAQDIIQAVVAALTVKTHAPIAVRDVKGIIPVVVSGGLGLEALAVDRGVRRNPNIRNRLALELYVAGDAVRGEQGDEVVMKRLADRECMLAAF